MMEAHIQEWLGLIIRWAHLVTGIAWIGASFYFNWLENHLERQNPPPGYAGDLWAVHGGGFYYLRKLALVPDELPTRLHWFKWEAYATWITGFALLCVIYYWNASLFLVKPAASALAAWQAIALGLGALLSSWLVYDGLCRSVLSRHQAWLGLAILSWFTLLAWGLGELLSARAAYIHTGSAIGTVMVANVFRVIIPAQKELVSALTQGRRPDPQKGARALMRSRHNNYLTLPVLFLMISIHYPASYAHPQAWIVLLVIALSGVSIRHWFNVRHLPGSGPGYLLAGLFLLAILIALTAPGIQPPPADKPNQAAVVPTSQVLAIVQARCTNCHAQEPAYPGFTAAPLGVALENEQDLLLHASRVYQSVVARSMPLGNLTQMTVEERQTIVNWHHQRQTGKVHE